MRPSTLLRSAILLGGLALLGARCAPTPVGSPAPPVASPVAPAGGGARETSLPVVTEEVTMTAAGFSPAELKVFTATTVTFRNADTKPHGVASDPHPVHTGLPGFDAGRPIAPGETYEFTFTSPGTFGFHDHLNPSLRGTVVVK